MERLTSYKNECKREMICNHEECFVDEEHCPHVNEDICPCLQEVLEKLAEYEDLEEQGKLLKLPCEIGQRVYMIYQFCGKGAWEIEEHKIRLEDLENIGKTVFLTREEAEAALKELERGKGE